MSLFFTIFVANKHNRFHNCQPEIVVSMRTNRKIYLTIAAQDRRKLATGKNFLINRLKRYKEMRSANTRVFVNYLYEICMRVHVCKNIHKRIQLFLDLL